MDQNRQMTTDVQVRPTTEDDRADVLGTVGEAFSSGDGGRREEVGIVDSVWSLDASIVACDLVAIVDKEIVGHVLASIGRLDGRAVPGIAPLAVRPDWQGQGIGTALMTELIHQLRQKGFPLVVLLGDPGYYGRFGFQPSGPLDAHYPPVGVGSPHFQVLRLGGHHEPCSGTYVYSWDSPAA
jgi:putative acetyltransferase